MQWPKNLNCLSAIVGFETGVIANNKLALNTPSLFGRMSGNFLRIKASTNGDAFGLR